MYLGTKKECAAYFGVKESTISFWSTPVQQRRKKKEGRLAIVVEED